jgi:hypothetical protein
VGVRVRDKDPRVEPLVTNNGRFIVIPPSGRYIGFPKKLGSFLGAPIWLWKVDKV